MGHKQTPVNESRESRRENVAKMMSKSAMLKRNVATTMKANVNAPKVSFVRKVAQSAGVAASTLALALSANAADVKLGSDSGGLVFEPSTVTINKGESVTWKNNAGFPHNIMFDEDEIPAGANADALSHEDYLNAPGETATSKFDVAGTYSYYCEPHQGAGMQGKVIVKLTLARRSDPPSRAVSQFC